MDNQSKVGIVRRLLVGLGTIGTKRILMMPDRYGLGQQALNGLREHRENSLVQMLDMPITSSAADSLRAGKMMRQAGAGCIIVLGGDGTARIVSKGIGETPMVALSTGTNNVLPSHADGTIAGIAAGAVAQQLVSLPRVATRHKWLALVASDWQDRALVDIAVLARRFVGSRAIWNIDDIRQIIVTRANPAAVGVTSIASMLQMIAPDEPVGLSITLGNPSICKVMAALAPGLMTKASIKSIQRLNIGDTARVTAQDERLILALDGEREFALGEGETVSITLRHDGPWIVDIQRTMCELAKNGRLINLDDWEAGT